MLGVIDTESEHNLVLFELGILDDMDDWNLFKQQEKLFDTDVDYSVWCKYVRHNGNKLLTKP